MKLYRIEALLLKYFYITTNSMDRIIDMFYWPLMGMIIFGFTTHYIESAAGLPEIFIFLMGGTIIWTVFERVQQDVSVYILEDFLSGNVANTFVTPIKESELFLSVSIFGFIKALISFAVMFLVALVAYQFSIFNGGLISMLFAIPLFVFGWGIGILISGMFFKYGIRIGIFAWSVTYLMQPIAAVYYPIQTLPLILQQIAGFTPLVYIFEGFRAAYNGTFMFDYFAMATFISFVYMIIGYILFVKFVKSSKKSGTLANY